METMPKADFITGLILISLSIYVIFESWRMPRLEHLKVHPLSVPGIVPAFIGTILLLFGLVLVIRSIRRGGHRLRITYKGIQRVINDSGNQRLLLTAFFSIGYAGFLIGTLPYWLATALFIFIFIIFFEWRQEPDYTRRWRNLITAVLISGISSAAITMVFERLFLVTLP